VDSVQGGLRPLRRWLVNGNQEKRRKKAKSSKTTSTQISEIGRETSVILQCWVVAWSWEKW
jgi:hypothetical protein